jgi:environmental stress-induced protein Ves
MIRHLTDADFRPMRWANGRGTTVEMARADRDGALLWRFSRAAVVEDGDFSRFPGVDRSLTVLTGPGFDLQGPTRLHARPLQPVAFPGDVPMRATAVTAPCEDFNVMVRRGTDLLVQVLSRGTVTGALFALGSVQAGRLTLARYDLLLTDQPQDFTGQAIAVTLTL